MRDPRETVAKLERRFMTAVAERDMDFLERYLGEEFTLTTGRPGNEVRGREEWLRITAERYRIEDFSFEELEILPYGHVAVARSRYLQRGSMDGEDRSQPFLMTDVWVRRKGDWVLVTRHISPLAPEGDANPGDAPARYPD
jgi:ketosteroid isomerase-like protein